MICGILSLTHLKHQTVGLKRKERLRALPFPYVNVAICAVVLCT